MIGRGKGGKIIDTTSVAQHTTRSGSNPARGVLVFASGDTQFVTGTSHTIDGKRNADRYMVQPRQKEFA